MPIKQIYSLQGYPYVICSTGEDFIEGPPLLVAGSSVAIRSGIKVFAQCSFGIYDPVLFCLYCRFFA